MIIIKKQAEKRLPFSLLLFLFGGIYLGLTCFSSHATEQKPPAPNNMPPEKIKSFHPPAFCLDKRNTSLLKKQIYANCQDQRQVFAHALKKAQQKKRLLLVKVGADWCPWCQRLHKLIKSAQSDANSVAHKTLQHYEIVNIARSFRGRTGFYPLPSGRQLQEGFINIGQLKPKHVQGIPYLLVFDPTTPDAPIYLDTNNLRPNKWGFIPFLLEDEYSPDKLDILLDKTLRIFAKSTR